MDDQGIEGRTSLGLEDACDGIGAIGPGPEAVDGLGGERDQSPVSEDGRGLFDGELRDQKLIPKAPANPTGKPPSLSANIIVERPSRFNWTLELRNIWMPMLPPRMNPLDHPSP